MELLQDTKIKLGQLPRKTKYDAVELTYNSGYSIKEVYGVYDTFFNEVKI